MISSPARDVYKRQGYTITQAQGVKVAFVAFTKGLGGRGPPAGNDNLVNKMCIRDRRMTISSRLSRP